MSINNEKVRFIYVDKEADLGDNQIDSGDLIFINNTKKIRLGPGSNYYGFNPSDNINFTGTIEHNSNTILTAGNFLDSELLTFSNIPHKSLYVLPETLINDDPYNAATNPNEDPFFISGRVLCDQLKKYIEIPVSGSYIDNTYINIGTGPNQVAKGDHTHSVSVASDKDGLGGSTGFMAALDKYKLETMYTLFTADDTSDVDGIKEILDTFSGFKEDDTLVDFFAPLKNPAFITTEGLVATINSNEILTVASNLDFSKITSYHTVSADLIADYYTGDNHNSSQHDSVGLVTAKGIGLFASDYLVSKSSLTTSLTDYAKLNANSQFTVTPTIKLGSNAASNIATENYVGTQITANTLKWQTFS